MNAATLHDLPKVDSMLNVNAMLKVPGHTVVAPSHSTKIRPVSGPARPRRKDVNLAGVDLNLLVALEALLGERSVTLAASRVGLSQPAMSRALGRLRSLFADDLLVRS